MPFGLALLVVFCLSFLLGSIPWGVVISHLFFHTDVRDHGSGNIGTTNSFRTMGKGGGTAVFILDFGKGLLAGILAWWVCYGSGFSGEFNHGACQVIYAAAFLGCVWGHVYSPWLHFHGGKGIAVAVGCIFVVFGILPTLLEIALFILGIAISRRVSVGSLAAAIACPFISLYVFWGNMLAWLLCVLAAISVIWAHRENIWRLAHGEESKIGAKTKESTEPTETSSPKE